MEKKNIDIEKMLCEGAEHRTPFKVPEGYFDTLSSTIMDKLPQQEEKKSAKVIELLHKPVMRWAAAIVAIITISTTLSLYFNQGSREEAVAFAGENNDVVSEMAEYAMFDNVDMYCFISEE